MKQRGYGTTPKATRDTSKLIQCWNVPLCTAQTRTSAGSNNKPAKVKVNIQFFKCIYLFLPNLLSQWLLLHSSEDKATSWAEAAEQKRGKPLKAQCVFGLIYHFYTGKSLIILLPVSCHLVLPYFSGSLCGQRNQRRRKWMRHPGLCTGHHSSLAKLRSWRAFKECCKLKPEH